MPSLTPGQRKERLGGTALILVVLAFTLVYGHVGLSARAEAAAPRARLLLLSAGHACAVANVCNTGTGFHSARITNFFCMFTVTEPPASLIPTYRLMTKGAKVSASAAERSSMLCCACSSAVALPPCR